MTEEQLFFYGNFTANLLEKRLGQVSPQMFGSWTRLFVPILSTSYTEKVWLQYEWSIAKLEAEKRQDEFILHIRVDDRLIVGFPDVVS